MKAREMYVSEETVYIEIVESPGCLELQSHFDFSFDRLRIHYWSGIVAP